MLYGNNGTVVGDPIGTDRDPTGTPILPPNPAFCLHSPRTPHSRRRAHMGAAILPEEEELAPQPMRNERSVTDGCDDQ